MRVLAHQQTARSTTPSTSDTLSGLPLGIAIFSTICVPLSCASALFLSAFAFILIGISGFTALCAWIVFFCLLMTRPPRHHRSNPSECRVCRYDLRHLPHVIDSSELDGPLLGPRSCLECGTDYPSQPLLITIDPH